MGGLPELPPSLTAVGPQHQLSPWQGCPHGSSTLGKVGERILGADPPQVLVSRSPVPVSDSGGSPTPNTGNEGLRGPEGRCGAAQGRAVQDQRCLPVFPSASQRLPAPPAAAAALPSAVFCCLPTEEAPAAPGPRRDTHAGPWQEGPRGGDISPEPQAGLLSIPARLRLCLFLPVLHWSCGHSRTHPAGPAPARPQGSADSPGTARAQRGLILSCFPPGHGTEAAPHWRSPFCSRAVSGHLLARPSGQVAQPVANPQVCPRCPRRPWPGTKAERPHNGRAAPPSRLGTGTHLGTRGWLPSWDLRSDIVGCSSDRVSGGLLAAGAGTAEFGGCWFRAEQPSAALSTGGRGLATPETPGVMGVCRTPCPWQQQPLPRPAAPGQPLHGSPLAALARQPAPGCCNRFPYCAREWLLKPDERERRGQRERERCWSGTSPRAAGLARRERGSGRAGSPVLRAAVSAAGTGQNCGCCCCKREWRGNTASHGVNHCFPWGCDTLGRLAGGRSSPGTR